MIRLFKKERFMKTKIAIIIVLFSILASACTSSQIITGKGNMTKEDRAVAGVTSVNLAMPGNLTIILGDKESLTVEAESNLLPYIETNVSNGELTIGTTPSASLLPLLTLRYTLTVKSLQGIRTSSSGNIFAPALQGTEMHVSNVSSGKITLDGLTVETLEVEISSSGNVSIGSGQVDRQTITVQSSGNYEAPDLKSSIADCKISSSGNATIWVTDQLIANVTSSGNVNYYGNPTTKVETSSSGGVLALGEK
jgi:hypothetical protein